MPACRDCSHFAIDRCLLAGDLTGLSRPERTKRESRACMHAIFQKHLPDIKGKVLEIGYGVYKGVRKALRNKGDATWMGVDARWEGGTAEGQLTGSAAHIGLCNDSVDWVLAFETIEHWEDFGESIEEGLKEISRVLKPGGKLLVSAPIYQHGSPDFILGRWRNVVDAFLPFFSKVRFEHWRANYEPLQPLEEWMHFNRKAMLKAFGKVPSMWKLEILATK